MKLLYKTLRYKITTDALEFKYEDAQFAVIISNQLYQSQVPQLLNHKTTLFAIKGLHPTIKFDNVELIEIALNYIKKDDKEHKEVDQ